MKIAVSAVALLIAGTVASFAQGTPTPSAPSAAGATSSNQCWDMATNAVKNSQAGTLSQGANTSAGAPSPGSPAPGAKAAAPTTGTTGMAPTARPAGMPNC